MVRSKEALQSWCVVMLIAQSARNAICQGNSTLFPPGGCLRAHFESSQNKFECNKSPTISSAFMLCSHFRRQTILESQLRLHPHKVCHEPTQTDRDRDRDRDRDAATDIETDTYTKGRECLTSHNALSVGLFKIRLHLYNIVLELLLLCLELASLAIALPLRLLSCALVRCFLSIPIVPIISYGTQIYMDMYVYICIPTCKCIYLYTYV